jgi:hypothetical protein
MSNIAFYRTCAIAVICAYVFIEENTYYIEKTSKRLLEITYYSYYGDIDIVDSKFQNLTSGPWLVIFYNSYDKYSREKMQTFD